MKKTTGRSVDRGEQWSRGRLRLDLRRGSLTFGQPRAVTCPWACPPPPSPPLFLLLPCRCSFLPRKD
ncbi:hypothetical protein BHM03_00047458 [Ensete ventricosum]|nr:hypothetical protein BHM03_00047458 [Ensete ventricosum]